MGDVVNLQMIYKGSPIEVICTLRVSAYTYQFLCQLDDTEIILEKDDEGKLRAIMADPFSSKNKKPDPALVQHLIEEMERILL